MDNKDEISSSANADTSAGTSTSPAAARQKLEELTALAKSKIKSKLDEKFASGTLNEQTSAGSLDTAREKGIASASEEYSSADASKPKSRTIRFAAIGIAGIAALAAATFVISTVGGMLKPASLPTPTPSATQAAPAAPAPALHEPALMPGMPDASESAGVDVERVRGIEIQDNLYSSEELIERSRGIEALVSKRPQEKQTCESLAEDEILMFNRDQRHTPAADRCKRVGANAYFACAPTGFSWDLSIPGCDLGFEAAAALQDKRFRYAASNLPMEIKREFLAIIQ